MKTKFSHNLIQFSNSVALVFDSSIQADRHRCLLYFSGLTGHSINSLSHAKLTPATKYEKKNCFSMNLPAMLNRTFHS